MSWSRGYPPCAVRHPISNFDLEMYPPFELRCLYNSMIACQRARCFGYNSPAAMNVTQMRVRSLLNEGPPGGLGGRRGLSMGRGADRDEDDDDGDDMDW